MAAQLTDDPPLPLSEHLIELRRRVIAALLALGAGAAVVYPFSGTLLSWLALPAGGLVFTAPTEAFFTRLKVACFGGFIAVLPVILYQAWLFVARAVAPAWRSKILRLVLLSYGLFLLGASLAAGVVVPAAMRFLLSYGSEQVRPMITLSAYLEFAASLALAFGLVFQTPVVLYALNKAGLVSRAQLASRRRYAYLAVLVAGALLTPGPDVFSQISLAVPAVLLFELTLLALA